MPGSVSALVFSSAFYLQALVTKQNYDSTAFLIKNFFDGTITFLSSIPFHMYHMRIK